MYIYVCICIYTPVFLRLYIKGYGTFFLSQLLHGVFNRYGAYIK